jgi:hypothetical protein
VAFFVIRSCPCAAQLKSISRLKINFFIVYIFTFTFHVLVVLHSVLDPGSDLIDITIL